MLRYAIPIVPAALAFWIIDVIDRYFLQVYTTTAQVGIYEIGYSIAAAVALGTAAFQQAWYPFAMSIQNVPRAREVYAQTFVAYTCVGCFACAGVTLFAPEAIRLLTTKAYYDAGSVVACLAFGYFFMGLTHVVCVGAALKKQTISIGAAVLIGAIVNIALNFWLIPAYGRNGAAVATLLGYIVVPVYMYRRAQRIYPIPYRLGQALMIIVFAVAVILAGSAMNIHDPWLAIMAKLGLLSLFFPLPFVLRIVTLSQFRTFARSAVRPFQAPANAIPPQ
jgi:O-antigen/teichoic acid export membrane protein